MIDLGKGPVDWKTKAPTRKTMKLRVERTTHGHQNGNVANVVRLLKLVQVDHHFVPTRAGSENDLQITYSIKGFENEQVKLRVACDVHDPKIIFERDLTDEEKKDGRRKKLKWNGVPNCASGPLEKALPSPMNGDLKVSLQHQRVSTEEKITRVLYREIKLEPVSWCDVYKSVTGLANDTFAAAATNTHQKLWIQYKLNELGYIAGPMKTPPDTDSILRALFRYTQAHRDLFKILDFQTLQSPPGTCSWGWRSIWERKFGTIDNLCSGGTTPEGTDLMRRLQANENPRSDVVENLNVFVDRKVNSRTIIDHDLHYLNKDFSTINANSDYDREFLNRFCWPIKARIFLVGRDDADATKPGVDSPEAVGLPDCNWIAYDPPEDVSCVPTAPIAPIRLKTRAREFLTETHKKLAAQFGDQLHALDNCPQSAGGERPSDPSDMSVYFEKITPESGDRSFIGCAVIQFKGSFIGGDNYVIEARVSPDGYPNSDSIKAEHLKLKGLENAFNDPSADDPPHPLHAKTGMITNWRRHHVSRELRWDTANYPEINWFPIIDNFRSAHIILVPPTDPPIHVGDLFSSAVCQNLVQIMATDPNVKDPNKTEFTHRASEVAFNRNAMYPVPLYKLTDYEASPLNKSGIPADPKTRVGNYRSLYLMSLNAGWPSYDLAVPIVRELRNSLNALNSPPGIVIVRTNYIPDLDFSSILPWEVHTAVHDMLKDVKVDRGIAVGMDYGVVLLDRVNTGRYAEPYFVTHEISHCLFGSHAFEEISKGDHDQNDKNCIMYYNEAGGKGNGGKSFGWGVKNVPAKYEMRLWMEYDPVQKEFGTLTGGWVPGPRDLVKNPPNLDVEYRKFTFTGSVEEIRKAFSETVFTPHKWVDPRANIRLMLEEPFESPVLSVKYPYYKLVKGNAGKVRPLQDIRVEPMNLRLAEPRFCGKCLLKLRGWRVGQPAGAGLAAPAPAIVPEKSKAVPINGRMIFEGFKVTEGAITFKFNGIDRAINFGLKANDPGTGRIMGPYRFLHRHTFKWDSSSGNMADLDGLVRESVLYDKPTQTGAFNSYADPDQKFAQSGGPGKDGSGTDDHSIRIPSLICSRFSGQPVAGIIRAKQSYQYCTVPKTYSKNRDDWVDIVHSQFILEKEVYLKGKEWIIAFRKRNDPDKNPIPFHFEIHYKIGPELSFKPDLVANPHSGCSEAAPLYNAPSGSVEQEYWASGSQLLDIHLRGTTDRPVTLPELMKAGFAIDGIVPMA